MPPSPLVVTDRLVFRYTVFGVQHRQNAFLLATPSADPSGFDAVARPGGTNQGISTLFDTWATAHAPYVPASGGSFDSMTFEQLLGGSWIPVSAYTTAVATASAGQQISYGLDIVGKDLNHKTIHAYVYEGLFGSSEKTNSYAAAVTTLKALIDYFFNVGAVAPADAAWFWRRSRTSSYAQNWLSAVWDSNEKLRRLRGIA